MAKQKLSLTERTVIKMLTENTGRHFLDSGGAYGRNWEHNQLVNFPAQPSSWVNVYSNSFDYTRSVYHLLTENFEYLPYLTRSLWQFSNNEENEDKGWPECVDLWIAQRAEKLGVEVRGGPYGEGDPNWINTYNGESNLSQTLQFLDVVIGDEALTIIQIHGGCDVRGGYTSPRVFQENGRSELSLYLPADGYLFCNQDHDHTWSTDDNWNWYYQGTCGRDYDKLQLNKMDIVNFDAWLESDEYKELLAHVEAVPAGQLSILPDYHPSVINPVRLPEGLCLSEEDNKIYCPLCRSQAAFLLPG